MPSSRRSSRSSGIELTSASPVALPEALPPGRPVEPQGAIGDTGLVQGGGGEGVALLAVDFRQPDAGCRAGEAVEMLVQLERAAVVDTRRLEGGASPDQTLVVRMEDGLVRIDDAAASDRDGEQCHASAGSGNGAPIAARRGRAFTQDSSISASVSESQTMPPPTQRWIRPSAIANVRIVSARSKSPFG